jgi:hypothetical protein
MAQFPPECTVTVALYHLPATGGSKQPYPGTADVTTSGAFLPLDRYTQALEGGNLMEPFELYLDPSADVRVGDKCVITQFSNASGAAAASDYFVKKIFPATFGGLAHQRISLARQA